MKRVRGHPVHRNQFSFLDVYDDIIPELERLDAIADLFTCTTDSLEMRTVHGVALILNDIRERTRTVLETALKRHRGSR